MTKQKTIVVIGSLRVKKESVLQYCDIETGLFRPEKKEQSIYDIVHFGYQSNIS